MLKALLKPCFILKVLKNDFNHRFAPDLRMALSQKKEQHSKVIQSVLSLSQKVEHR